MPKIRPEPSSAIAGTLDELYGTAEQPHSHRSSWFRATTAVLFLTDELESAQNPNVASLSVYSWFLGRHQKKKSKKKKQPLATAAAMIPFVYTQKKIQTIIIKKTHVCSGHAISMNGLAYTSHAARQFIRLWSLSSSRPTY